MKFSMENKVVDSNVMIQEKHPMKRKTSPKLSKIYEIAIKHKGSTVLEEYFPIPDEERISDYRIVVTSSCAEITFIDFKTLSSALFPYPDFKKRFIQIATAPKNKERNSKKISTFLKIFGVGKEESFKDVSSFRKKKIKWKGNQNLKLLKKKKRKKKKNYMSSGGYNTIIKGSLGTLSQDYKNFNIEEKIIESGIFNNFIKDKKRRVNSFNLKNYLKTLNVDNMTANSCFTKNFVIPPSNLSSLEKLEMISKSKRIMNRRMNSMKSKSFKRFGTMSSNFSKSNVKKRNRFSSQGKIEISKFTHKNQTSKDFYKPKKTHVIESLGGTPSPMRRKRFRSTVFKKRRTRNLSGGKFIRLKETKRNSVGNKFYLNQFQYEKCEKKSLGIEGTKLPNFNKYMSKKKLKKKDTMISIF